MLIRAEDRTHEPTRHGTHIPKEVIIRGGILPSVTQVAIATFNEILETELHKHPTMYEVYYILAGRATYTVGNKDYEVRPGDFMFVPPDVLHKQRITEVPHKILYWGIAVD